VSRRTSPADRMEGRRVPLTSGATLRFGSLDFIYTGPAESVAGCTFTRPPRPNVLTGGRETHDVRPRLPGRDDHHHVGAKPNTEAF
jgi:hypothetical protein